MSEGLLRIIVNAVVRDAVTGLRQVETQADETGASLKKIGPQADAASDSINNLSKSSRGLSSLKDVFAWLAIGGALTLIATGITLIVEKYKELKNASKEAAEAQKDFEKSIDDAAKAAAKNATEVTKLFDALQSGTLDPNQRKEALKQLKDQDADYFGSLNEEKGTIEGLTSAYDAYLQNLTKIGVAKAIEAEITKIFDKKLQLQLSIDPKFLTATSSDVQTVIGNLQKQLNKLGGPVDGNADLTKINDNLKKRLDLQSRINELQAGLRTAPSREVDDTNKQIAALDLRLRGLQSFQQSVGNFQIKEHENNKKSIDEGNARLHVLENIKRITDELAKGSNQPIFKRAEATNPSGIDAKVIEQKVSEAIQGGIKDPKNKDVFDDLAKILGQQLNQTLSADLHVRVNPDLQEVGPDVDKEIEKFNKDTGKTLDERMRKLPPLKTNIKIQPDAYIDNVNKFVASINQAIQSIKVDELAQVGIALGDALNGGADGFQNALKGFAIILADGLKQIGIKLIEVGGIMQVAQKALAALYANPPLAIAAGIGLIALSQVLRNSVSKTGAHAFAEGGIVTQPTLGLVGESGAEAIIPLHKLDSMMKNMRSPESAGFVATTRFSGADMLLLIQRASKNQGLV